MIETTQRRLIMVGDKTIEEVCAQLKQEHPDWVLLSKENLTGIFENRSKLFGKTFIIPGNMVDSRKFMSNAGLLITHFVSISRPILFNTTAKPRTWEFVVVASHAKAIDEKIRQVLKIE